MQIPIGWFGRKDPLQIIAFKSYGTTGRLFLRGRALEDESIDLAQKGTVQLLLNSWKRFETDEIRNTPLEVVLPDGQTFQIQTNSDGYYLFDSDVKDLRALTDSEGWLPYRISYNTEALNRPVLRENDFSGAMLIPSESAAYGVITDIDDTILHTGVTSYLKWQVIANTLFKRAESRIPLHGAADLYHILHRGKDKASANPVFYVSHSPWNLYRYLEFFLSRNHFPQGPIILRSMASVLGRIQKGGPPQKLLAIENILQTYPDLSFILIGDSGEKDADIYLQVARKYPGRILAIYLRSVRHSGRMRRVRKLIEAETNTPIRLVDESEEVLYHVQELGIL
jgi:phosphatidate phosphatase APP1